MVFHPFPLHPRPQPSPDKPLQRRAALPFPRLLSEISSAGKVRRGGQRQGHASQPLALQPGEGGNKQLWMVRATAWGALIFVAVALLGTGSGRRHDQGALGVGHAPWRDDDGLVVSTSSRRRSSTLAWGEAACATCGSNHERSAVMALRGGGSGKATTLEKLRREVMGSSFEEEEEEDEDEQDPMKIISKLKKDAISREGGVIKSSSMSFGDDEDEEGGSGVQDPASKAARMRREEKEVDGLVQRQRKMEQAKDLVLQSIADKGGDAKKEQDEGTSFPFPGAEARGAAKIFQQIDQEEEKEEEDRRKRRGKDGGEGTSSSRGDDEADGGRVARRRRDAEEVLEQLRRGREEEGDGSDVDQFGGEGSRAQEEISSSSSSSSDIPEMVSRAPREAPKRLDPDNATLLWSDSWRFIPPLPPPPSDKETAKKAISRIVPKEGDIVVPDDTVIVEDAVSASRLPGQRVFAKEGSHLWMGQAAVSREGVEVTGEENAKLIGSWFLKPGSSGCFTGISLAQRHRAEVRGKFVSQPIACISGFGGEWRFQDCEMRAVKCTVLRVVEGGTYNVTRCSIGGVDTTSDLIASTCVVAMDDSVVGLFKCRVEDSGDVDQRPLRSYRGQIIPGSQRYLESVSGGIRSFNKAIVEASGCYLSNNDASVNVNGASQMSLVKCKILLGEVCMFYTRMPQDNSLLNLTECSYTAKDEWLDKHRPYTVIKDGVKTSFDPTHLFAAEEIDSEEARRNTPVPLDTLLHRRYRKSAVTNVQDEVAAICAEGGRVPVFDDKGHLIAVKKAKAAIGDDSNADSSGDLDRVPLLGEMGIGDYEVKSPFRLGDSSVPVSPTSSRPASPTGSRAASPQPSSRDVSLSPRKQEKLLASPHVPRKAATQTPTKSASPSPRTSSPAVAIGTSPKGSQKGKRSRSVSPVTPEGGGRKQPRTLSSPQSKSPAARKRGRPPSTTPPERSPKKQRRAGEPSGGAASPASAKRGGSSRASTPSPTHTTSRKRGGASRASSPAIMSRKPPSRAASPMGGRTARQRPGGAAEKPRGGASVDSPVEAKLIGEEFVSSEAW